MSKKQSSFEQGSEPVFLQPTTRRIITECNSEC